MGFGSSTPLARPVSSRRCKSNTARSRPVTNGATLIPHLYVSSHSSSSTLFSWCYGSERRILRLFCFVRFPFLFSLSRILACEPFNTRFLCLRLHIVALPSSLFRPSRPLSPLAVSMLSVHCGWFFDGNINDVAEGRLASDGRVLALQPAVTYLQSI